MTGRRTYLRETINGTDKAAYKRAEKALTKLLAQVDNQRHTPSTVSLSFALDEWMRTSEIEDSTRHTYSGYIDRSIKPALGETAVNKIPARMPEGFYTDLRRCRARRDSRCEATSSPI
ncbi:N-terminal phage integrase SAM-like domain-containing protein [Saccharopolyspora rhizosphaerae]|uniref:N-terminal phage integrase SAM-like domain-containing protein n=1 Tax=Saccharopolyspora rhizosphaerae TaxID=2492662 RepID=UPI001F205C87|nr:N-terminal phage integrase SAM-like domain-containing protein [Saccharopolyspora rhizosphaerae]